MWRSGPLAVYSKEMFKNKKTLLIIGFTFLLAILGYYLFVYKKTPTPVVKGELKIVDTNPSPGKVKILHPTTGILFSFDDPLVLSSAKVTVDPSVDIVTELARGDSKTLVVRPKEAWQYGVNYKIVIKSGLSSITNKELKNDFSYEVTFDAPEDIMSY
jgi:hypothetical protein